MIEVNKLITRSLNVEEELVKTITLHLANSGGKRLRPMLTLLSAKLCDYQGQDAIKLATAIEFIHMATLLHDDVIDGSMMRRFLPTANNIWGSKESILVGDFLFSQSFKLIVSTKNIRALDVLSNASAIISEGEIAQLGKLKTGEMLSIEQYYKLISAKTAELFSAACEVGAIIAEQDNNASILKEFGLQLGILFQISDDLLDYFGNSDQAGKNIGDDFAEGKITLPLILLERALNKEEMQILSKMLKKKTRTEADLQWVKDRMFEHKIIDMAQEHLQDGRSKAAKTLNELNIKENKSLPHMLNLLDFIMERTY